MSLLDQIRQVESGGSNTAKNPMSSAYGPDQFIKSTWRDVIGRMRPDLARLPERELQAMRANPDLSRQAAEFYMNRDIAPRLQSAGFEANPANAYLGWFLGPGGAVQALRSSPEARLADVLPSVIGPNANIRFRGKSFPDFTVADLRDWSASKMGGAAQQSPQTTPASVALAPPTAVPATSAYSNAPVYSSDAGTTFRQIGNTVAPGLVDAPTPLTPEQAATQRTADAATAQQYGNVSGGLLGLAQLFAQQEPRPRMQEDEMRGEITRGQYRPIQGMRGLL